MELHLVTITVLAVGLHIQKTMINIVLCVDYLRTRALVKIFFYA